MFSANLFLPPALHKLYSEYYRVRFLYKKAGRSDWQEKKEEEERSLKRPRTFFPPVNCVSTWTTSHILCAMTGNTQLK